MRGDGVKGAGVLAGRSYQGKKSIGRQGGGADEREGDEDEDDGKVISEGGLENEERMPSIFFVK